MEECHERTGWRGAPRPAAPSLTDHAVCRASGRGGGGAGAEPAGGVDRRRLGTVAGGRGAVFCLGGTAPRDPDVVDDSWQERAATIRRDLSAALDPLGVPWEYHQLAGRADRALTHLARAVDAAVIVVGARPHGRGRGLRQFFTGSTAVHLAHHQHRPVMVVPVDVVDWQDSSPWQ